MKILHAPVNTANIGGLLRKGQRQLGHTADVHDVNNGPFKYDIDKTINRYSGQRHENLANIFQYFSEVVREDYDIYHFYYFGSLLPRTYGIPSFLDIDLLKGIGNKKFFFHLVGCDFRLPELSYSRNKSSMCISCNSCKGLDKLDVLEKVLERADGLIVGGNQSKLFLPGINANVLPNPIDTDNLQPGQNQRKKPFVVHAPTNRNIKGTNEILNAIAQLKAKNLEFDFKLIENLSNTETIKYLSHADILVDQTGSDFYGTAALEAMSYGTVVLTGILPESQSQFGQKAPVYPINNDNVTEVLEEVINDHNGRVKCAKQSKAYVREYHNYKKVAEMSLDIYHKGVKPLPSNVLPAQVINSIKQQLLDSETPFKKAAKSARQTGNEET